MSQSLRWVPIWLVVGIFLAGCVVFAFVAVMHNLMQHPHIPTDDQLVEKVLNGHTNSVSQLRFIDDNSLVSASWDGTLKLWDVDTGRETQTLKGSQDRIGALALARGKPLAATGGSEGKVVLWDLDHSLEKATTTTRSHYIEALAFVPDSDNVLATTYHYPDHSLIAWDSHTGAQRIIPGQWGNVVSATLPKLDNVIITSAQDGIVAVWDNTLTKRVMTLPGHSQEAPLLSVAANRPWVAAYWMVPHTGSVWDLGTCEKVCDFKSPVMNTVSSICLSPSGDWLVLTGCVWAYEPGMIELVDARSGRLCRSLRAHESIAYSVAISPDGRLMATGGGKDHSIKIWSLQKLLPGFKVKE